MVGTDIECSLAWLVFSCVTECIFVFGVDFVKYSNVVFMEGRDRECSVARLVLYCMTVCILVFGVE